jgi:hypothetical protein
MSKHPLDLAAIQQAHKNLDRIAREHPELVDHERAQWAPEDVAAMIDEGQGSEEVAQGDGSGKIDK